MLIRLKTITICVAILACITMTARAQDFSFSTPWPDCDPLEHAR
jgi:hypothetical protein